MKVDSGDAGVSVDLQSAGGVMPVLRERGLLEDRVATESPLAVRV